MSTPPTPPDPRHPDDLSDPTGIRALLGRLPDPGPMPPDLVARINASLASEQLTRERGQGVVPLRPRHSRWRRGALVAAAAAVVAIGLPALLTGTGPGDVAALLTRQEGNGASAARGAASDSSAGSASSQPSAAGTRGSGVAPKPGTTDGASASALAAGIHASGTAYTTAALPSQLRAFVASPGSPVQPKAAGAHALGLVATAAGLLPCLRALGVAPGERVTADVATYDGSPAVVIVVDRPSGRQGYVMSRSCATSPGPPLAGPVPLG